MGHCPVGVLISWRSRRIDQGVDPRDEERMRGESSVSRVGNSSAQLAHTQAEVKGQHPSTRRLSSTLATISAALSRQ
jgi:hypothetical protein